jgi:phosphonate transport system substrate-binding protein
MRLYAQLFLLAALALPLAACGNDAPTDPGETPSAKPTLRFSAIPGEKATKLKEKFTAFGAWLSKELGVPVEYVASDDYGASVKMFEKGEIQFAWFGGLTGVQARQKVEGAHAIAQGAEDPEYYSYFIAHKDAGITPSTDRNKFPEGLEGKTFAFASP